MAKKTLESNRKRKARDDDVIAISSSQFEDVMKKVGPAARDEATTKKKKKIDGTNSKKNKKTSKNGDGSNRKIAAVEKEKTKKKAAAAVKTPVKKGDKKVRAQRRDEAVKKPKGKVKKVAAAAVDGKVKNDNGAALYVFPMACVSRIVKSETCDTRMRAEAMFLVNKASEKFIEILSQGAYACASKGRNKKIEYKHLSSFIPKDKRYEFLTDFVPVKVRAADALKEVPSV